MMKPACISLLLLFFSPPAPADDLQADLKVDLDKKDFMQANSQLLEPKMNLGKITIYQGYESSGDRPKGYFIQVDSRVELSKQMWLDMDPTRSEPAYLEAGATIAENEAVPCGGRLDGGMILLRDNVQGDGTPPGFPCSFCFYFEGKVPQEKGELVMTLLRKKTVDDNGFKALSASAEVTATSFKNAVPTIVIRKLSAETEESADPVTGAKRQVVTFVLSIPSPQSFAIASRQAKLLLGNEVPSETVVGPSQVTVRFDKNAKVQWDECAIAYPRLQARIKVNVQEK
jgi:hypothetical protein